nr:MAG TPA: hypothetical protein [Caudoviricetes sp.]
MKNKKLTYAGVNVSRKVRSILTAFLLLIPIITTKIIDIN